MKKISVFDTTISDYNLGNQIIMEGVYEGLEELFPHDFFFKLPYMEITKHTINYLNRSDLVFFGGTNSLNGRMETYRQWDVNLKKSFQIKDVILMGIGWWQYEKKTSLYSKFILKQILNKKYFHSVRDSHTKEKLEEIGFKNVLNTGCPTLWSLEPSHCQNIPTTKSKNVVFTLTDYNKDPERDLHLIKVLSKNYDRLYYWIQGEGDLKYVNQLKTDEDIVLVDPNLKSYDKILENFDLDYVGTRLHAGIRALQKSKRSLIIGIDNRAIEMHKDFNLPVINQINIKELDEVINTNYKCQIRLPNENIQMWKSQFIK